MTGYYDLVLGLIPLTLFGISGTLYATGTAVTTAVLAGGLIAIALVGHALFVNGPVDAGPADSTAPTQGPAPNAD